MTTVQIADIRIAPDRPLAVIAGPCVIESEEHCLKIADAAKAICDRLGMPFIFKCSFDKANRTSVSGFRGPGLEAGLAILGRVKKRVGVPVLTDLHLPEQAGPVGEVCDILQIPAFLCRQTDLLLAAGQTGRVVNVKKGQFMAPEQMGQAVKKVQSGGASGVLLTDRGTFFGYGRLVNDAMAIPMMREFAPVVIDATHSCQIPGGLGDRSGGLREYVPVVASAGVAAGADVLFIEIHNNPDAAKSDAATVYPLSRLEALLQRCRHLREAVQATPV